ncbi:MAG: ParB/RepB/Spo0J family partition protein [Clostridiales bacterium]|nr:ParB/RepB/Spo0J family partition protein [Clostridiales bacterium]
MAKKGLGRGLDALLAENTTENADGITVLRISDIEPNLKQVRKSFDAESLAELAESIKEHGLIQPIVVRRLQNGFYQIIAGERRWRASKLAGLTEIPVIIRDFDDISSSLVALVENLQRENLNPVEEAYGYKSLMENHGFTQDEVSQRVGKSRPAVANVLRILSLPEGILVLVKENRLSFGHARTLIPLVNEVSEKELMEIAERVIKSGLSVRETEFLVKNRLDKNKKSAPVPALSPVKSEYYRHLESDASARLGRRVSIYENKDGKGYVRLAYSSPKDLENLVKALCGEDFFDNAD